MSRKSPSDDLEQAEALTELQEEVKRLSQLVLNLTLAVDHLTDEIERHLRQIGQALHSPASHRTTSLPLDPTTDNWQINRATADDLPVDSDDILFDRIGECEVLCRDCDADPVTVTDAIASGWTEVSPANALYFGLCPVCSGQETEPQEQQQLLFGD